MNHTSDTKSKNDGRNVEPVKQFPGGKSQKQCMEIPIPIMRTSGPGEILLVWVQNPSTTLK